MEFTSKYNYKGYKYELIISYGNVRVFINDEWSGDYPDTRSAMAGAKSTIDKIVSGDLPTHNKNWYNESNS